MLIWFQQGDCDCEASSELLHSPGGSGPRVVSTLSTLLWAAASACSRAGLEIWNKFYRKQPGGRRSAVIYRGWGAVACHYYIMFCWGLGSRCSRLRQLTTQFSPWHLTIQGNFAKHLFAILPFLRIRGPYSPNYLFILQGFAAADGRGSESAAKCRVLSFPAAAAT